MVRKYTVRGVRIDGRDYVEWEDLKHFVRLEQQNNPGLTVDELITKFDGGEPVAGSVDDEIGDYTLRTDQG